MIVFFVDSYRQGVSLSDRLMDGRRSVDGPFHCFDGEFGGRESRLYVVEGSADTAYAAGRMALRRGAAFLVPILGCLEFDDDARHVPGEPFPIGSIHDLADVGPMMRLLPDSGACNVVAMKAVLGGEPLWQGSADGPSVASLPFPLRNVSLASSIGEATGVRLFNKQAVGYAAAAKAGDAAFRPLAHVALSLSAKGLTAEHPLLLESILEEALAKLLGG